MKLEERLSCKISNLLQILNKRMQEQEQGIKIKDPNFSWLNEKVDPELKSAICLLEDLLKIDWRKYTIDEQISFVEETGDAIGEGGFLRFCIFHIDENLKVYSYHKKSKERIFIEFIFTKDETTITYPGGHTHTDLYDYKTGEYTTNNEVLNLFRELLKNEMKIRYVFRGNHLVGSGIWEERNKRFWMNYGVVLFFNPIYWFRKIIGYAQPEKEEIVFINWRK